MSLNPKTINKRKTTKDRSTVSTKQKRDAIVKTADMWLQYYIDEEQLMAEPNKALIHEFREGKRALKRGDYETASSALQTAVELWQSDLERDEVAPFIKRLRSLNTRLSNEDKWRKKIWRTAGGKSYRLVEILDSKKLAIRYRDDFNDGGWDSIIKQLPDKRIGVFRRDPYES